MASFIDAFQAFSGILVICPCCKELVRLAELKLRYTGPFEQTILDSLRRTERSLAKREQALERAVTNFEQREEAIRQAAIAKGRKKLAQEICKIEPFVKQMNYDPHDIKVICFPVDLIVFEGLSNGIGVKNVVFIARSKSTTKNGIQRSLEKALSAGKFVWETIRMGPDGLVHIEAD